MGLEDFERELAQSQEARKHSKRSRSPEDHERRHHRHHHHRHRDEKDTRSRHDRDGHRHKRRRSDDDRSKRHHDRDATSKHKDRDGADEQPLETAQQSDRGENGAPHRDTWMQKPSSLDVEYVQRRQRRSPPSQHVKATQTDQPLKVHENEMNKQLQNLPTENQESKKFENDPPDREITYTFGDDGSHWRMTKLKAVYRQAEESGRPVDDIAFERFGDLRDFDDAREEELELDRRERYGQGYVGKDKPSGELFQERKLEAGVRGSHNIHDEDQSEDEFATAQGEVMKEKEAPNQTVSLDQNSLNKLKAQMMKAKLRKAPEADKLEAEYNNAMAGSANAKQPDVVVLNKMENRMLAGREGEVKHLTNKRGQERGLVEENEDMSIEDMVKHERRSKHAGDSSKSFADRIAKDSKFTNDLDYMDDNATKLSKAAPKSDINLRNTAIEDYRKMKHILDTCPLCHHEDTSTPPQAPLVSLATRTYLTLPTSPEITPQGLCATIVPIQHRVNLLQCDEDEWEEIRNFMKALSRFYYAMKPGYTVIFYENAAHEGRKRHASLECVPLPLKFGDNAPAFFREAILSADEEWTQHRKIIDTGAKANDGLGKLAFRRSMVSELPYFHVWFTLDGGFGHVVEDPRRWPKGDLFAREIIGGILDVSPEIIKRQGRWKKGDPEMEKRVTKFKKGWEKFDWTSVLMDAQ